MRCTLLCVAVTNRGTHAKRRGSDNDTDGTFEELRSCW